MLYKNVHIARRYLRSVRIDSDLTDGSSMEGFLCTESFKNVLITMANHISQTDQSAFTWTGPYGSGKSSLVVALSSLLSGNCSLRAKAEDVFGQEFSNSFRATLPLGKKGWRIIPVVGSRENPINAIGEMARQVGVIKRRPRGGWNERNLIKTLKESAYYKPDDFGGLLMKWESFWRPP